MIRYIHNYIMHAKKIYSVTCCNYNKYICLTVYRYVVCYISMQPIQKVHRFAAVHINTVLQIVLGNQVVHVKRESVSYFVWLVDA